VDAAREAGEPGSRNAAVAACRAPIVACCDADDVVRPGWLTAIVEVIVGGAHAVCVTREYWTLNPGFREAGFPETRLNAWLAGGAFAVRRELYLELGGFDPTMPICADTEFGFRLQQHVGRLPMPLPDAVVSVRMARSAVRVFARSRRQARTWPELRRRHPTEMAPAAADMPALRCRMAWWLLRNAPLVAGRRRLRWFEVAGTVVGEFEGSIRRG
jgi:GT2 family glycosyltransferase